MKVEPASAVRPLWPIGIFRRDGPDWIIAYSGLVIHLRDTKGLRYLAHLLGHPGRMFPVADLAGLLAPRTRGARYETALSDDDAAERTRKAVTNRVRQTVARIGKANPALGLHLVNSVHTGRHCVYTPERPIRWGV